VFGVTNRINKMKNKKYHTTRTVPKSNRTTVEREETDHHDIIEILLKVALNPNTKMSSWYF
jgi:hypothetical protein